ncbi:hypothetical protein Tco_1351218, partial [Tanacetum coccineum]
MDLFAFIRHSDPTKVVVGERNVTDGEVKLLVSNEGRTVPLHYIERDDDALEETIAKDVSEVAVEKAKKKLKRKVTEDASGSTYPPKKLRDDYQSVPSNTGGKSLAAIRCLISKGSGIPSGVTKPRIATSVVPTSDDGPMDSVSGLNLRTRPPCVRYVVSSDDSHHSGSYSEANSFTRSPVANASVVTAAVTTIVVADVAAVPVPRARVDLDTETMHRIYVPRWKVINDSILEDPYVCRNLTNRLASPALFTQLRAMDYDQLYSEFNVRAARQVCLEAEVRMRVEHTLEKKGELEDKCAEQVALLSEKGAEIANLKSLLSLKEAKAAEAIRLRGQLSIVEAADAAKGNELKGLKEKNLALEEDKNVLSGKVTTLESVTTVKDAELASLSPQVAKLTFDLSSFRISHDELSSKVASLEFKMDSLANQAMVLGNRVAELDAQLLEVATHLDEEFYPRFFTAISGRRWILTHGLKLVLFKCLQSTEYLRILGEAIGCAVNKGMQDGLAARIDHGKARRDLSAPVRGEIEEKRLSLTDAMVPLAEPLSLKSLIGEASTSAAPAMAKPITTLSMTFASFSVVPPLLIFDYQVLDMEPHNEDPPAVTFKKEELDTTPE